jgi:hypothetical protein
MVDVFWNGPDATIQGCGRFKERSFLWEASVTPLGWYVSIHDADVTKLGEVQGATFNLPLEVAAAVRRLM